jgi:hypothetical protein
MFLLRMLAGREELLETSRGLATAKAFTLAGASVVAADHNEKLLNEAAEKLQGECHNVLAVTCDVSDKAQVAGHDRSCRQDFWPSRCCFQQRRYQLQRNAHGGD